TPPLDRVEPGSHGEVPSNSCIPRLSEMAMTALRSTEPVLVLIENVNAPGRYLCEFNANWRAVMFPVSQPREFRDDRWGVAIDESPVDAAGRAVCEATGQLTGKSMLESL